MCDRYVLLLMSEGVVARIAAGPRDANRQDPYRRCCTNRPWPARCPPTGSSPADAIRHWSTEGGHPIQDLTAEDGLTPLPGWAPGAKAIADDGLVAEERVLHPALTMVPGHLLPTVPADLLHQRDRPIPRGQPRAVARYVRRLGRWDDDRRTPRPRRFVEALLHESSLARTMPTDRIPTCRCDTTLVGRGRSSDSRSHSRGRPHSPAQLGFGREGQLR